MSYIGFIEETGSATAVNPEISITLADGTTQIISSQLLPYYNDEGVYTPILFTNDQIPFTLIDGTVTYLQVAS